MGPKLDKMWNGSDPHTVLQGGGVGVSLEDTLVLVLLATAILIWMVIMGCLLLYICAYRPCRRAGVSDYNNNAIQMDDYYT